MTKKELTELIKRLEHYLMNSAYILDQYTKERDNLQAKAADLQQIILAQSMKHNRLANDLLEVHNQLQAMEGKTINE